MIRDSSFSDIIKYKKYKDLCNIKSIEVIVAFFSSIIFTFLLYIIISNSNYEDINNLIRSLTKDIAIALIGLLGFIVTGLAILTSAISNKLMNILREKQKIQVIERILLSFYLLGFIIGITILIQIIMYVISFISIDIIKPIFYIIVFIITYLVVFILFYSIALIGNCVQIFNIINIPIKNNSLLTKDDRNLFDSFRISALEKLEFKFSDMSNNEKLNEYKKVINELIEDIDNKEQRERLKLLFRNFIEKDIEL